MYALAVKKSDVVATDVDSGEKALVPLEVQQQGTNETATITTPCNMLVQDDQPRKVEVASSDYYPLAFDDFKPPYRLYVKKRFGSVNPFGEACRLKSYVHTPLEGIPISSEEYLARIPPVYALPKYVKGLFDRSSSSRMDTEDVPHYHNDEHEAFFRVILQALRDDKELAIPLQLSIEAASRINQLRRQAGDTLLVQKYYENGHLFISNFARQPRLLRPEFVASLCEPTYSI